MSTTKKRKASKPTGAEPHNKKLNATLKSFFPTVVPVLGKSSVGEQSRVALNDEQTKVLQMVIEEGKNIFFTGAAGTGKSLLLRAIISALRRKYSKSKEMISITASTGRSASLIGGTTIHSWGAITPNCTTIESLLKCIRNCKPALQRWKSTVVLIIDEVSMVDGQLFQKLHDIAVRLRKPTKRPFGGIQIVVTGDFFQLPPVTKNGQDPMFAFESSAWQSTIESTISLTHIFRQNDSTFISALNVLRLGTPTNEAIALFKSLSRPLPTSGILPTELFPLRAQVAQANSSRLNALPTHRTSYIAGDSGCRLESLSHVLADRQLDLKVDAQVMLIKNIDEILVNGTVGSVLGFFYPHELTPCLPNSGSLSVSSTSSPSSLTSSLTGKKMPTRFKSDTETKKNGALLRFVQLLEDERTPVITSSTDDKENWESVSLQKGGAQSWERYPLVRFEYPLKDGSQGWEAVLIGRDEFRVEDAEGKLLARRIQLPLILAWAMSIHKSQGQTIHRVKVDLTNVFERGQSYVALSRASTIEGVQVIGFDPKKVVAHPKVIKWSENLGKVQ